MRQRCGLQTHRSFRRYGGRGISVCSAWSESFEAFLSALGPRPAGATIGRIDHNRGYEPGNVRWMSRREQDHPNQTELPLRFEAVQLLLPLEGICFQPARPSSDSRGIAPLRHPPQAPLIQRSFLPALGRPETNAHKISAVSFLTLRIDAS